jgi:hypothetical protein
MDFKETDFMAQAQLIVEAVALNVAAQDADLEEAKFRAHLVTALAHTSNLPLVAEAAVRVTEQLQSDGHASATALEAAIEALSVTIDQAQLLAPRPND